MQRPNVSLITVEPVNGTVQGASLPSGKAIVIDGEIRNCLSNVCIMAEVRVQSIE